MSEAKYWGGMQHLTVSGSAQAHPRAARVWSISTSAGTDAVLLPDARTLPTGGPQAELIGITGTGFTIKDATGATIVVVAANQTAIVMLRDKSTAAGSWRVSVRPNGVPGTRTNYEFMSIVGGAGSEATKHMIFDPVANAWTGGTGCPHQKIEGAALHIGPRAVFVGRWPITSDSVKTDELQPGGTWVARPDVPLSVGRTCGVGIDGVGYLFGTEGSPASPAAGKFVAGAWVAIRTLPMYRTRASARAAGGRAYLMSGEPVPITNLVYDPSMDVYWAIANYPSAFRHSLSTFAIGEKIYAAGGYNPVGPVRVAVLEEYTPNGDAWVTRTAMPAVRYGGAAAGVNAEGIYACGRDNSDAASFTANAYGLDSWRTLTAPSAAKTDVPNLGVGL